jgi:hypothetical protein
MGCSYLIMEYKKFVKNKNIIENKKLKMKTVERQNTDRVISRNINVIYIYIY